MRVYRWTRRMRYEGMHAALQFLSPVAFAAVAFRFLPVIQTCVCKTDQSVTVQTQKLACQG